MNIFALIWVEGVENILRMYIFYKLKNDVFCSTSPIKYQLKRTAYGQVLTDRKVISLYILEQKF